LDRARSNVEALVSNFEDCVLRYEKSNTFSGPAVYFHRRAIERRRLHGAAEDLLADKLFLEYVYALLPAWACTGWAPSAQRSRSLASWPAHCKQLRPS
jgi:hypothetical protein